MKEMGIIEGWGMELSFLVFVSTFVAVVVVFGLLIAWDAFFGDGATANKKDIEKLLGDYPELREDLTAKLEEGKTVNKGDLKTLRNMASTIMFLRSLNK
ncbi:MAG: hypothetical protein BACC_04486 [Bacteroides sp.]